VGRASIVREFAPGDAISFRAPCDGRRCALGHSGAVIPASPELTHRIERALADARRAVERSQVLRAARQLLQNEHVLITRCAWCHRFALGGTWLEREETPRFLPPELARSVTHGICPNCVDDLRERGLSV
jgi:hypothetical protein